MSKENKQNNLGKISAAKQSSEGKQNKTAARAVTEGKTVKNKTVTISEPKKANIVSKQQNKKKNPEPKRGTRSSRKGARQQELQNALLLLKNLVVAVDVAAKAKQSAPVKAAKTVPPVQVKTVQPIEKLSKSAKRRLRRKKQRSVPVAGNVEQPTAELIHDSDTAPLPKKSPSRKVSMAVVGAPLTQISNSKIIKLRVKYTDIESAQQWFPGYDIIMGETLVDAWHFVQAVCFELSNREHPYDYAIDVEPSHVSCPTIITRHSNTFQDTQEDDDRVVEKTKGRLVFWGLQHITPALYNLMSKVGAVGKLYTMVPVVGKDVMAKMTESGIRWTLDGCFFVSPNNYWFDISKTTDRSMLTSVKWRRIPIGPTAAVVELSVVKRFAMVRGSLFPSLPRVIERNGEEVYDWNNTFIPKTLVDDVGLTLTSRSMTSEAYQLAQRTSARKSEGVNSPDVASNAAMLAWFRERWHRLWNWPILLLVDRLLPVVEFDNSIGVKLVGGATLGLAAAAFATRYKMESMMVVYPIITMESPGVKESWSQLKHIDVLGLEPVLRTLEFCAPYFRTVFDWFGVRAKGTADLAPEVRAITLSQMQYAVFVAPVVEEVVKRYHVGGLPIGLLSLLGVEWFQYVVVNRVPVSTRLPSIVLHCMCYCMPYMPAVLVHGGYNLIACLHVLRQGCGSLDMGLLSIVSLCVLPQVETTLPGVVVEEVLKHSGGVAATLPIIMVEMFRAWSRGDLYSYIPTAAMHLLTAYLPLSWAVSVHTLWNTFATVPGTLFETEFAISIEAVKSNTRNYVTNVCFREQVDTMPLSDVITKIDQTGKDGCVPRPGAYLSGIGSIMAYPIVFRSCRCNEQAAISLRVGVSTEWGQNHQAVMASWRTLQRKLHTRHYKHYYMLMKEQLQISRGLKPTSFTIWNMDYPQSIKMRNIKARMVTQTRQLGPGDRVIKAFVKTDERIPILFDELTEKTKKPRLIQGRTDEMKVFMGPTMHGLGKVLRTAWHPDEMNLISYMSGVNAETVGFWFYRGVSSGLRPKTYDIVSMDASVSPPAIMGWSDDLNYFGAPKRVVAESRLRAGHQVGKTAHGIKYEKMGQVNSGDGDTSVGNSAIHGKIWMEILEPYRDDMSKVGLTGDDSIVLITPELEQDLDARVAIITRRLGFVFEEEVCSSELSVRFCSGRLWAIKQGFIFGPQIGRVLAKTFWCYQSLSEHKRLRWLRGISLGMHRDTNFIPILRVLMRNIVKSTAKLKPLYLGKDFEKIHSANWHEASDETFNQCCYLYNCTREQLEEAEMYIDSLDCTKPFLIRHSLIDKIVTVDLS